MMVSIKLSYQAKGSTGKVPIWRPAEKWVLALRSKCELVKFAVKTLNVHIGNFIYYASGMFELKMLSEQ